jgi:hypothetical protein
MKTKAARDWYESIHFDKLSCWQVSFSKCTKKYAENVYVPLVMVSIGA